MTRITHRIIPPLTAIALLFAASTAAQAVEYGTNWGGIHESSEHFGVDIDAGAGVTLTHGMTPIEFAVAVGEIFRACNDWPELYYGLCIRRAQGLVRELEAEMAHGTKQARAELDASATLLGHDQEILFAELYAQDKGGTKRAGYGLRVLGVEVASYDTSRTEITKYMPIFGGDAEKSIGLGPFSVSVEAGVGGFALFQLEAGLGSSTLSMTATPSVEISAFATAGFDAGIGGAGVDGELTLLSLGAPATASLRHNGGSSYTAGYEMGVEWTVLSGSMSVWGELLGLRKSLTLYSFTGWEDEVTLTRNEKTFSF